MHSKYDQAINFFENGNLNESKKLCLEILKDEPKNFDILHLYGIISFQLKNYKKSSELISEAIKINPKDGEAYNNMGIVLKELNQFDIAHNNFCNAIKLMAGVKGLEPSTYRVTGDRSNQLSYTPFFLVGGKGLEPLTPSV